MPKTIFHKQPATKRTKTFTIERSRNIHLLLSTRANTSSAFWMAFWWEWDFRRGFSVHRWPACVPCLRVLWRRPIRPDEWTARWCCRCGGTSEATLQVAIEEPDTRNTGSRWRESRTLRTNRSSAWFWNNGHYLVRGTSSCNWPNDCGIQYYPLELLGESPWQMQTP